ncbi:leucine-rich repeat serine/threonine-protein kinase 2 isoform X2 [Scleropages formosus]|uniref:leucine-rich repeat serine/threonine-protein kinase 2 isoform X2 n=1 Tax=Scleropages formosus TaxID=113540 RepID=UPI0010FA7117|nr:leucine-rich repeat serine/threonine-protein kinase 2 isoform X2 [Scleropages formosus]
MCDSHRGDTGDTEELRARLRKLTVRLRNMQEGKQLDTLVQILLDLLDLADAHDSAPELFEDSEVLQPLMVVLSSYTDSPAVQQVGFSLLGRLVEICSATLDQLSRPLCAGGDWDVLGIHQQILKVLSVHARHCGVILVVLKVLASLLKSDVIVLLVLEDDMDVFDLLVHAMRCFHTSEEILVHGCRCLQQLLDQVPEEHLLEFVNKQDHSVVLDAARVFHNSEEVLLQALRVLLPLADPAGNVEMLMSGNEKCYSIIKLAMESFPNNEPLQEVGCCLFQKFMSDSYYDILVLNGVHRVIARACAEHEDNAKVQAAGLFCLAALTHTVFLSKELEEEQSAGKASQELSWEGICCRALEFHTASAQVQEAACLALNNLLLHNSQLHQMFGDVDGRTPIHRQVMAVMLLHSSSRGVFQTAASTLGTLIDHNSKIRALLLSSGIHINVVEMMKKHPSSPKVAESACELLYKLFQGRTASLDELAMAMCEILRVMKVHNLLPGVQFEALKASLTFLNPDRSLREHGASVGDPDTVDISLKVLKNQCVLEGALTVCLEALNRFIGMPHIQIWGLRVLCALADCSGALELLCQQGAIDTTLHALLMFPSEREVQLWGLSLLQCLVLKKEVSSTALPVLASLLVSSLRRYETDTELLLKGFQVAGKLLDSCAGSAAQLEREDFDRIIFEQLRAGLPERNPGPLQKLSCSCLSQMAADSDIRYAMLEKACMDGDVIMAECLIQLGADVNRKTKTESLIYQVCERGGPLELVELLLASGIHEQNLRSTLSASVHQQDGPVVSQLLGKLGLDTNNNALCLGGFRLGHIEASWLVPLVSERRALSHRKRSSRGVSLARAILSFQRRKSTFCSQRIPSDPSSLAYLSDESDELSYISMDESIVFTSEDLESDGSDETSYAKSKSQRDVFEDHNGQLVTLPKVQQRRPSWEGSRADSEPRFSRAARSHGAPGGVESLSLVGRAREHIRLLDLSGNELDNLSCLTDEDLIRQHLEHIVRLDLSQNNLSEFPDLLCENLRSLTRLDLHGNRLQSLPAGLLSLPSLSTLSLSQNCVGPLLMLPQGTRRPSLKQINLSFNHIAVFPSDVGHVLDRLEELSLEGNKITELCNVLCLPEMRLLDVSKNSIQHISPHFLCGCPKLETFSASVNKLCHLSFLPSRIATLKLCDNHFTCIPEVVLQLPHLRSLDMRNNDIAFLPGPSAWTSVNLRELILSRNRITTLDIRDPVEKWTRLEKLHLSENRLTEIPGSIGLLENLTSLDVSRNEGLCSFPDEMGMLGRLWDLPLEGLQLNLDLKHIGSRTKDIVRFLQQRLKNATPYFRMKLIVVGNSGSGKTTLLRRLMKLKRAQQHMELPTSGIDIKDWSIRDREKRNIVLNVWDFSGGEEYKASHHHFMTQRALYLVVYDLSKGSGEVDALKPWLFNIKAMAPVSPVIVVGTHTDVSEEHHLQACMAKFKGELVLHHSFATIREHHMVNACEESDSLRKLRRAILREATSFKIQGQPVIGQRIPDSYLELERRLLLERSRGPPHFPVLLHQKLMDIVQEQQLQLDETELAHAVHFLSEAGVLLHFDDPALQLRELYFIKPQWLCSIISQILILRSSGFSEHPKGIVQRSSVEKFLLESKCFPRHYLTQYLKLLEKFQIALPICEDQLLIPSRLSDHRPVIELPHSENSEVIIRLYEMPYFPMGFWSRQLNRLLEISYTMLSGREKGLRPNRIYWRTGIYLSWSPEAYCLVESATMENTPESFIKITVPCSRKGRVLLAQVVDHIDSLLEEWFPGLLTTDVHGSGETLLKKWVLYSFEDGQQWNKMLLEELFTHINEDCLLVNPRNPKSTVHISQIAPDLFLSDLPSTLMLNSEELEIDFSKDYLLGHGGFGSVYRALYKNEEVAVKIFNKHASKVHIHRLLRQELTVLGHLFHPSLVSLLAASICPPLLVMELAPRGSLDSLFERENGSLNRKLQHRIALQVADGLRYLHASMIVYRDLKPHNILLFNLKMDSEIIAKITDYGIAQYCCSIGVRTSEGTPGFRAPEVTRGNVIYNQQADVYSFGLLMYDLLTCGERISDGMKFPNPVKHYGCSPWPHFEDLMKQCMKENPQDRPTSSQVFDRLNSGEMLCLMREVAVCRTPNAECFAVAHGNDGPCICIGGGSSSQSRGCVTYVQLESGKLTTQEIDKSPVLCVATVRVSESGSDWLVAGTQSGALIIISPRDMLIQHCLQSVTDAVTSLYFHSHLQDSKKKSHLLVGTADGVLVVYEDSEIQRDNGQPLKTLVIGNVNTPLMCLGQSSHSLDRTTVWAGCGTRVLSLTEDYDIWKSIETKSNNLHQRGHKQSSDTNLFRLVVDKHICVSKAGEHTVELWDKKSEKMTDIIDCAQILRHSLSRNLSTGKEWPLPGTGLSSASVKALLIQPNAILWIGTRGGHVILLDLSTCRPLRVLGYLCQSVRSLATAHIVTLNPRNVVIGLGRSSRLRKDESRAENDPGEDSVLLVWNSTFPQEVRDLQQHCDMRKEITERIRLPLHD